MSFQTITEKDKEKMCATEKALLGMCTPSQGIILGFKSDEEINSALSVLNTDLNIEFIEVGDHYNFKDKTKELDKMKELMQDYLGHKHGIHSSADVQYKLYPGYLRIELNVDYSPVISLADILDYFLDADVVSKDILCEDVVKDGNVLKIAKYN